VKHELKPGRGAFLHVATGALAVNGHALKGGDAIAVDDERAIEVMGVETGEAILFDLA
jgi:redox-sensitive bicupin YhaK (pirin superfamily)